MKRLLASLLAACGLVLGTGAVSSLAQADTPGCVSLAEFKRAKKGMPVGRVNRVFDTRGEMLDGAAGGFAQGYKACGGGGVVIEYGTSPRDFKPRLASKTRTRYPVVNCVTYDEWRQVNPRLGGNGGTRSKIHRIFGTAGKRVDFYSSSDLKVDSRKYRRCGERRFYRVDYNEHADGPWWSYWG